MRKLHSTKVAFYLLKKEVFQAMANTGEEKDGSDYGKDEIGKEITVINCEKKSLHPQVQEQ